MSKKVVNKVKRDNEQDARRAIIEDLFYDFHSSRKQVYTINFVRGIFFGLGSVLGGTLVVAVIVGLLSWFTDIPGWLGEFIQFIVDTVQKTS